MDPNQPNINPTPNPAPTPDPAPVSPNPAPAAPQPVAAPEPTPAIATPEPAPAMTAPEPATATSEPQPVTAQDSTATTASGESSTPQPKAKGGKKRIGLIIGIVVGILAIVGVVILIANLLGGGFASGPIFESKAFFIQNKDKKYILINADGQRASDDVFDEVGDIVDGMAWVKKDGKTGIIKENGQMSINFDEYENEIMVIGAGIYGVSVDIDEGAGYILVTGSNRKIAESDKPFVSSAFINDDDIPYVLVPQEEKEYDLYDARGRHVMSFESDKTPVLSSATKEHGEAYEQVALLSYSNGFVLYDMNNLKEIYVAKDNAPSDLYTIGHVFDFNRIYFYQSILDEETTLFDDDRKAMYLVGDKLVDVSSVCSKGASTSGELVICNADDKGKRFPIDNDGSLMKYPYNSNLDDERATYIDTTHFAVYNSKDKAAAIYVDGEVKKTYSKVSSISSMSDNKGREHYYVIRTYEDRKYKTFVVKADSTEAFSGDDYYTVSRINSNGQMIIGNSYSDDVDDDEKGYFLYGADGSKIYGPVYSISILNDDHYSVSTGYVSTSTYYLSRTKDPFKDVKGMIIDATGKEVLNDTKYIAYSGQKNVYLGMTVKIGENTDDDDDEDEEKNSYSYGTYDVEIKYAFFDKDFNKIAEDIEEDDVNTSHDKYFIIHKGDSYKYYNMDGKEIYSE